MKNRKEIVNPWKTLSEKNVYENPWIQVSHREVINPKGGLGIYGKVHFKNIAVGVVPLDEDLNTWIVGQYRYTLNQYSWEIPEGGAPTGTDPLIGGKRELLEETGIVAEKWTKILEMDISNSVSDERSISYLAQSLSIGKSQPEETEELIVKKLPFSELFEMVLSGEIRDSLSVASVFKVNEMLRSGLL